MKIKNHIDKIAVALIFIALVIFGRLTNFNSNKLVDVSDSVQKISNKETNQDKISDQTQNENIKVHISGCVLNPGLYELNENSRVYDLVQKAGGFCSEVDENSVNLAKKLTDEMKIHIYRKDEITIDSSQTQNGKNLININTAPLETLITLSGIGEAKARAIIEYREIQRFETIDDLKNISGIGEKLFKKIKDLITVNWKHWQYLI